MQPDWAAVRDQFPALRGITYLNTATYGQTPKSAVEAVVKHLARRDSLACSDFLEWFDDAAQIRSSLAELINASSGDDIAFVSTSSTALAWLLNGLEWRPGDLVVTLRGEFPNHLYAPAMLDRFGVEFVETDWDGMQRLVEQGRVRAAFLSTVNYATGFRPPLDGFGDQVRRNGGVLYVDGTQSVGALSFDVQAVRPDMLAVNAYKWMISPNGAGFAYLAPGFRSQLRPSVIGWRSDRGWRGVDNLHHGLPVFSDAAEAFEGGMLNFPSVYAMGASVDLMLRIGIHRIEQRILHLAHQCCQSLETLGGNVFQPDSSILAVSFPDSDASSIARELASEHQVHASARHGRLRLSVHFYNDESDLHRLADVLKSVLERIQSR